MIQYGSAGREEEIEELLKTTLPKTLTKAWMKTVYDPQSMLLFEREGKIQAFLQLEKRNLTFQGRKFQVSWIDEGILHPGIKDKSIMQDLFAAAMEISAKTDLFCALESKESDLFGNYGFLPLCSRKTGTLRRLYRSTTPAYHVASWNGREDLYPLYREFMNNFDGSVILDDHQFHDLLRHEKLLNHDVLTCHHYGRLCGLAIVKTRRTGAEVETLIYRDLGSINALLQNIEKEHGQLILHAGACEHMDTILKADWQPDNSFLIRINNLDLLNRCLNTSYQSSQEALDALEKPSWNWLV